MKCHVVALAFLFTGLVVAQTSAQDIGRPLESTTTMRFPRKLGLPVSHLLSREIAHPPASASLDIDWVQCPAEAEILGAMCGYVPVPLDRQHPDRAKIRIYFELYVHSNPGPAESAIMANPGGPGYLELQSAR